MLFAALIAFLGTLIAFAGVTALLRGWLERRHAYLLACGFTLLCLSVGLGAAAIGLVLEFRPVLFRVYEVGVALLAMVWVAAGIVELAARGVVATFAMRLFATSVSIVVGVILSIDPLPDTAPAAGASGIPAASELYMPLPLTLLAATHASVVLVVSACFFAIAARAWHGDKAAGEHVLSCLLILVAVLFVLVATRPGLVPLPPSLSIVLVTSAAALVWVAAVRSVRAVPVGVGRADGGGASRARRVGRADQSPRRGRQRGATAGHAKPPTERAPTERAGPDAASKPLSDRTTSQLGLGSPTAGGDSMAEACGVIVIFTLREGAARPFDRLVAATAETIREREPDTLVYACHSVRDAPQQRICYELYRDRAAMRDHDRQEHVRRFIAEREQYVLATNVVRLELNSSTGLPEPQLSG